MSSSTLRQDAHGTPLVFDILVQVVDRLYGTDLINFALASRYFHVLASTQIGERASCPDQRRLSSLRKYLCEGDNASERALLLVDLTIYGPESAERGFWRIHELITQTSQLVHSVLEHAQPTPLRELGLSSLSNGSFELLTGMKADLRLLTLSDATATKAHARDLLAALANFPALESLTMRKVHAFAYAPDSEDLPCIPSLRVLRLETARLGHF
ncbi:hypothetical protein BD311DRAFT_863057 [Dichomitus squalens]|uniref:F-box domain-containing protein n=1 Tax=Dichomitus squalens TaxID=114155 RepID=A0A4Q9MZM7_9APHY|nr:hypothetical protein BD311DRAFT_863057 [Dichomitus squalens]